MTNQPEPKETRVLLNGCWDLAHAGHFNALLQVREIASKLPNGRVVAGIHSNSEIARVKGGTFVYTDAEKRTMLEACRFVDAIVMDVPYRHVTEEGIASLGCDYAVHGSDAVFLEGTDMYGPVKQAGKYFEIPRSENIATTDLIERILCSTTQPRGFSLSARRLFNFTKHVQVDEEKKNLLLLGHFDLFHPGHVEVLGRAKLAFPEFNLLVGILSRPAEDVLTEGERMISLVSCRYVDDVVVTATPTLSQEFVEAFKIAAVLTIGNHPDFSADIKFPQNLDLQLKTLDAIDVNLYTEKVKNRILSRSQTFIERNDRKLSRVVVAPTIAMQ